MYYLSKTKSYSDSNNMTICDWIFILFCNILFFKNTPVISLLDKKQSYKFEQE